MPVWDDMLDPQEQQLRGLVREVVAREIAPRAAEVDATGAFPAQGMRALAESGIAGIPFPEACGGTGASLLSYLLAVEEIARACATTALVYMTNVNGTLALMVAGTPEQQARWLPPVARGQELAALALSEPGGGSDLAAIATTARRDGDCYVLDGTKVFITNGAHAGVVSVFARTQPGSGARGLSCFLVRRGVPGFTAGRLERKMGMRGSDTAQLLFDGVRVPVGNRIGAEGDGFAIAMGVLNRSRLSASAQALGIASGAYAAALRYAGERTAFGRPIAQHQAVQALLADMYSELAANRVLLYQVGRAVERGGPLPLEAAVLKVRCSDMAMRVTTDAVQVLGGYGYLRDYGVERMMRDAKVTQIYEGTNQILRSLVARLLPQE